MTEVVPIQETFSFQPLWSHEPAEALLKTIKLPSLLDILHLALNKIELRPLLENILCGVKDTLQKCEDYDRKDYGLARSIIELVSLDEQSYSRPNLHVDICSASRKASPSKDSQSKSPQYSEESSPPAEARYDGFIGVRGEGDGGGGSGNGDGGREDKRGSQEQGGSEDEEFCLDLTSLHHCHFDVDKIAKLNGSAVDSMTLYNCTECASAVLLLEHPAECQTPIEDCSSCQAALGLVVDHALSGHHCQSLVCMAVQKIKLKHPDELNIRVRHLITKMFRRSQKCSDGNIPVVVENFTSPERSLDFPVFSQPVVTHERSVNITKSTELPLGPVFYGEPRQLREFLRKWEIMKADIELTGLSPDVISEGVVFDSEKLTISQDGYRCGYEWQRARHIGSGNFGSVYIATDCTTGTVFCVKQVPLVKFHSDEVEIHSSLDHPHIAKMLGAISSEDKHIYILMQYIEGCNLKELIEHNIQLDAWFTLRFAKQLLYVIIYLQEKQILHEDLKAENTIIDMQTYTLYVIDFGLAQRVHAPDFRVNPNEEACGTPITWSPEKARSEGYDVRSEVWAAGCIIVHCLRGQAPWMTTTCGVHQVMMAIAEKPPPLNELPPGLLDVITDLVKQALLKNSRERPMPDELIKHPAFELLDEDPLDDQFFAHIYDEDDGEDHSDHRTDNDVHSSGGKDGNDGGDGDDSRVASNVPPTDSLQSDEDAGDIDLNVSLHSDEHSVTVPEDLLEEARAPQDSDLIGIQSHLDDVSKRLPVTLQRPHSLTHDPYTPPQHQPDFDPWVNNNNGARIICHRNKEFSVCGPPSQHFSPPVQQDLFSATTMEDVPDLSIFNSGSSYMTVIHNPVEPSVIRDQRIEFRWFDTPEVCLTSFRLQDASTWGAVVLSVAPQIHVQLPAFTVVDGNGNALDLEADIENCGDIAVLVKNASYLPYRWRLRRGELDII